MAVYTEVSDEELRLFLSDYDLGAVTAFKGIAEGVENSNFFLGTTSGNFILTLYEKRVRSEDLPYFLGLMEHLAAHGFACPTPVQARDRVALRRLAGRPAAIVTFLDGLWPKRVGREHCSALGAALAEMHLIGSSFPKHRGNDLSVSGWRPLFELCAGDADRVLDGLAAELESELAHLEANWPEALPSGVIHADVFPDNVFFMGNRLSGIIDYYFACNDFFAYELATCLNAWCFETDGAFNVTKARLLLQRYRDTRPISAVELEALPLLARGSALRFLLTRLYDWLNHPPGAFVKPKDPIEYLKKLRFHQGVRGPGAYGLG